MKTPLLLLGICASVVGTAQTIELEDTLSTGDAMTYYVLDSNATAYEDITGADVVWDYSEIGAYMMAPNVNNVIDREDSDFAEHFPGARYTEAFENSVHTYFTNDDAASEVIVEGFVFQELSNDFIIKYNVDPLIALDLPMSLGDSYTDAIEGVAVVPVGDEDPEISGEATIEADGTGTLKLGGTDYTNVIRVHTTEISEGTILFTPATITRESYVYYDIDNFNMPIFIHATILLETGVGDFGFTAVYGKDEITDYVGLEEESTTPVDLSIYPNPVDGTFTTVSTSEGTEQLTIMNSVGQVVRVINNPQTAEQIDVSDLERGVYFVQALKGASTRTEKFIVK